MWVRGLKLHAVLYAEMADKVAPRVGAWIETFEALAKAAKNKSHPVWVRGLKPIHQEILYRHNRRTPCGCVD